MRKRRAKTILVGESGGPTPVIDWEVAGILDAAQRRGWQVYGMVNGLEGLLNANIPGAIVDLTSVDPMSFAFNGPGAGLATTRINPDETQYARMARHLKALAIDGVVYVGGNDSAGQLSGLARAADVRVIHGIKTIDNDLRETHHCPGYGSAALFNAVALKNAHSDYASYAVKANYRTGRGVRQGWRVAPVLIYQVMGRDAGWLAQAAGFAKVDPKGDLDPDRPPHVVLCYEVPFSETEFLDAVARVIGRLGHAVVVVQEDLRDRATGRSLDELHAGEVVRGSHGNKIHGGAASFSPAVFLADRVREKLRVPSVRGNIKNTALVPQHIQRSCMMSPVDASEAYRVGAACVDALAQGATKKSVVLRRRGGRTVTDLVPLAKLAWQTRRVPKKYIDGLKGPTQSFVDEFIYLIGGPAAIPHYSGGRFPSVAIPEGIGADPYVTASVRRRGGRA